MCVSKAQSRDKHHDPCPTSSSCFPPSLPPFFPSCHVTCLSPPETSLSSGPSLGLTSLQAWAQFTLPTHFSCLPLLPDSCRSSKGPSMLGLLDLCTGHSLSLACSSPTCPHGSLLHHLQVFTHLPPVFTPTHTSYPPFPLFLLSIYHKHMFCTEYRLQENKDFLNACILSSRMASGSLARERRGLCCVPRSALRPGRLSLTLGSASAGGSRQWADYRSEA